MHRHVHMRTAAGAGRAQLVPDQRGQSESPEPDAAHVPGKPVMLWPTRGLIRRWSCTPLVLYDFSRVRHWSYTTSRVVVCR